MEREGVPALCGRYNGTVPGLYVTGIGVHPGKRAYRYCMGVLGLPSSLLY
jgi:hypothetical protein